MSLVSASGLVSGIKEYIYHGIQQLPIVLAATSLLFTITTGSVAHANLAGGLIIIIPFFRSYFINISILDLFVGRFLPFTRSTGKSCDIIQSMDKSLNSFINSGTKPIPSYWLTSISFFIGYVVSNAVDSLTLSSESSADPTHIEKRKSQAVYCIIATLVISCILLVSRFRMMSGCEGLTFWAKITSIVAAAGAAVIGYGVYGISRNCKARASDLLGILSQILPASASSPHPIVCAESD